MLLAHSASASFDTPQFVLVLNIDAINIDAINIDGVNIDGVNIDAAGQQAPAVLRAALRAVFRAVPNVHETWLPPRFQIPQLYDTGIPAAPILTLAPAPASLDISPRRSQAVPCAGIEAKEEQPIAN
jgi:hypothetical protein